MTRPRGDPNQPVGRLVMKDFPGFAPNIDPHILPPGTSSDQVNAVSIRPGEMRVRPGFAVVQFDTER